MKKTVFLTALLAAASITGFAYNLYAPNSFDPVSPKSWDYMTVETLCREGKAPSYTTDFFSRGSMTRYELASVIKDMLEHHNEKDKDHESLMKLKKECASAATSAVCRAPGSWKPWDTKKKKRFPKENRCWK
mgnify:CR=1 FL=1